MSETDVIGNDELKDIIAGLVHQVDVLERLDIERKESLDEFGALLAKMRQVLELMELEIKDDA